MTHRPGDVDDLLAALREDLPDLEDERRVRARLTAAGLAVGGSAAAAGGSTAATAASAAGTAAAGGGGTAVSAAAQATAWGVAAAKLVGSTKVLLAVGVVVAGAAYPVASSLMAPTTPATVSVTSPVNATVEATLPAAAEPKGAVIAPTQTVASVGGPLREPGAAGQRRNQDAASATPWSAPRAVSKVAPDTVKPDTRAATPNAIPAAEVASLEMETALIERALSALRQGDTASARYWLAEHERRFPNGALVLERRRALERLH